MRRSDLHSLNKPKTHIQHEGHTYTLHQPSWEAYTAVQRHMSTMNKGDEHQKTDASLELMVLALLSTLEFEDEDGVPVTRDEAQMIAQLTGMHTSPVVNAALEHCGIIRGGDDAEEGDEDHTDLPF